MGQRKSGLTVPADQVQECQHAEVTARVQLPLNQYVCGGCGEKVVLVILQAVLMTPEGFEKFKAAQSQQAKAAQRRSTGLVTPDEVRQKEGQK